MTVETIRGYNSNAEKETSEEVVQYVTFLVADEIYGISVHSVQSINEMQQITPVPQSSSYVEGVINLRGTVVPVINMRKKHNLPVKEYDLFTVIIIVEVKEQLVGIIVDSVSDVVSLPVSDIQKEIKFSSMVDKASIEGIGKLDEQLVILLNLEHFFDDKTELTVS